MIVSASYRTDIPAFYSDWFANRLKAGFCRVKNPYGGPPSLISLREGVDGFVFWTRNIEPFFPILKNLGRDAVPFIVQYTVTGYPNSLERSVPDSKQSIAAIRRLAGEFGPRCAVWRYDPILLSGLTPPEFHIRTFAALARNLSGSVDEVVVSFAQSYRKTMRNLEIARNRHGFSWRDPDHGEKEQAISRLTELAAEQGIKVTLCTQPSLSGPPARCIDAQRLADIGGKPFIAKTKGNRPGCLCAESRDIGRYDTCAHGCVYCYAVSKRETASQAVRQHNAHSDIL